MVDCSGVKGANVLQDLQDAVAQGLPQLGRHAALEPFVNVDSDTQQRRDARPMAALLGAVAGPTFLSKAEDTVAALERAFTEVRIRIFAARSAEAASAAARSFFPVRGKTCYQGEAFRCCELEV